MNNDGSISEQEEEEVIMVYDKKDSAKVYSSNSMKPPVKRPLLATKTKPNTSSTTRSENGAQNIKVIVRVRPHNEMEMRDNYRTIASVIDEKMLIFDPKEKVDPFFYQGTVQKMRDLTKKQNKELQFIFDRVFDGISSNTDVFEDSTKHLINNLLDGYNCSVFAYGATGAGKTHTMLGKPEDPGIICRTVAELYSQIGSQDEHRDFNLGVTYLEIYNENVYDLLHKSTSLSLRDDGRGGVVVADLKVVTIKDADELMNLLAKGNQNRTQHPTDANQESSRSHAVFQVYINISNKLNGQIKQVKLSMIDLAGSERASATGCRGARFKEGANINKSLLALGNCINNLADGIKHIPYRNSKLTRLLKDSLGGNCQTIMIANVAPTNHNYEDTYNTLKYADRAKKIKTSVKKNIVSCEMHVTGYIKMVEEQKKEIEMLKQKLLAFESNSQQAKPKEIENDKEEANERFIELGNRLIELLEMKKMLNGRILSLESTDKIICCRMQYKKAADERLHNLSMAIDGANMEEQNASGKSRLNKSLHYFKKQRESLKLQINSTWKELCQIELGIKKLNDEIKDTKLTEKISDRTALYICEIEKRQMQHQFEHNKKVNSVQQCEMQSLNIMIKMMSTTLQNYYHVMMGHGAITDSMKFEFKQLVKSLEGIRNIKWSDSETSTSEDFYNLTCLSTAQILDPLNNDLPSVTLNFTDDDDDSDECFDSNVTNPLSSTFINAQPSINNITIVKEDKLDIDSTVNKDEDNCFNNTFFMQEGRRKRELPDKSHPKANTPAKKARKMPKDMANSRTLDIIEKENKNSRKQMSAKNVAILNKLKSEHNTTDKVAREGSSSMLKEVREKERRGLLAAAHPYHKSNAKTK